MTEVSNQRIRERENRCTNCGRDVEDGELLIDPEGGIAACDYCK